MNAVTVYEMRQAIKAQEIAALCYEDARRYASANHFRDAARLQDSAAYWHRSALYWMRLNDA